MRTSIANRFLLIALLLMVFISNSEAKNSRPKCFPAMGANGVNPDTHLELLFDSTPVLGTKGQIRVYESTTNRLVDQIDLSIPPGPITGDTTQGAVYTPVPYKYSSGKFTNATTKAGTPSGMALPSSDAYQLTIIGGFTDGFHFYPVLIKGTKATIYLHNNLLEYDKSYYVEIDQEVFTIPNGRFDGFVGKGWTFTTKATGPSIDSRRLTVCSDGSGDFSTVQGAIDYIPDHCSSRITIFIRNGVYEEIVYFRNKENITIVGESREGVVVTYANNEVFNPHPKNIKTNEVAGTFPSRRAAFAVDHCKGIHLVNMTIRTTAKGQAEGLLVNGEEIIVYNVTIIGSGDALQTNGTAYYSNCLIIGDGDTVLGRGSAYFSSCELRSHGTFMWIRNTESNHGNVFVDCKFTTLGNGETEIARAPTNHGKNYPYCEAVLINCTLSGISPVGWGPIGGETSNVHYWEYQSINSADGKPIDGSQRHSASRQLTFEKDSLLIRDYANPAFVLGGWSPDNAILQTYNQLIR